MTLTITNAMVAGYDTPVTLHTKGNIIDRIGTCIDIPANTEVLDAAGMAVIPGLVNGHTHAAMTLFRGAGDDMPLMSWLTQCIWPAEARLTEDDVYWGTRLACLEMIRSGTVAFQDGYWHFHAVARAVQDSGLRAAIGIPVVDAEGPEQGELCKKLAWQAIEIASLLDNKKTRPILFPHAIYSVSPDTLRWSAQFAEKHGLITHIHVSETQNEVNDCLHHYGVRPAFHLDNAGLLNERCILAHGVFLDDAELDLISERGATLITNPTSNLKLAVGGIFPYERAKARGIAIGLGTDGAASNNSLDMFQEMKTFAMIQKHAQANPTAIPAQQALDIATGRNAPILGQRGSLTPGNPADMLLVRLTLPEMTPNLNILSNLAYSATGHIVDTTIVDGKILMRNRVVADEALILQEVTARARKICQP